MKYSQARWFGAVLLGTGALVGYICAYLLASGHTAWAVVTGGGAVVTLGAALVVIASTRREAMTAPWHLHPRHHRPARVRAPGRDHEVTLPLDPRPATFDEVIDLIDRDPANEPPPDLPQEHRHSAV